MNKGQIQFTSNKDDTMSNSADVSDGPYSLGFDYLADVVFSLQGSNKNVAEFLFSRDPNASTPTSVQTPPPGWDLSSADTSGSVVSLPRIRKLWIPKLSDTRVFVLAMEFVREPLAKDEITLERTALPFTFNIPKESVTTVVHGDPDFGKFDVKLMVTSGECRVNRHRPGKDAWSGKLGPATEQVIPGARVLQIEALTDCTGFGIAQYQIPTNSPADWAKGIKWTDQSPPAGKA